MEQVTYLIDRGMDFRDINYIKRGISRGNELLKSNKESYSKKNVCKLYHFIGNGYRNIFDLEYNKRKGFAQNVDNRNLQCAKYYYRKALKESDAVSPFFKTRILTNYANCLDILGRGVDALFAYDDALRIDPNFAMALGNKAMAMRYFADISGSYRGAVHNSAYKMLKSVENKEDLIRVGGQNAKIAVTNEIKLIEKIMDKETLSKDLTHKKYDLSKKTSFEKFYIKICSDNDLFLNFHIHEGQCEASIVDPIFIRLLLPLGDNKTFFDLAKTLNQIKEDYAVSRLLLVQSQFKKEDLNRISKMTLLVNTIDHSMFDLYVGLLKSAFKGAYSILDKIARFLNDYFILGLNEEDNIYFTTRRLWKDKIEKKWITKLEIKESENPSLCALYDIYLDFNYEKGQNETGYYKNLRETRNKLMHEKLIIHNTNWEAEEDIFNIQYENMFKMTIKLLKIVKSAIIYLINAVEHQERKNRRNNLILNPIIVNTSQFSSDFKQ